MSCSFLNSRILNNALTNVAIFCSFPTQPRGWCVNAMQCLQNSFSLVGPAHTATQQASGTRRRPPLSPFRCKGLRLHAPLASIRDDLHVSMTETRLITVKVLTCRLTSSCRPDSHPHSPYFRHVDT